MKWYIRHFDKKSFWNFALKGRVFFYQKKFGFYAMNAMPSIYLKKFSKKIKTITIVKSDYEYELCASDNDYYDLDESDLIQVEYTDGSVKIANILFNPITNSYYYR